MACICKILDKIILIKDKQHGYPLVVIIFSFIYVLVGLVIHFLVLGHEVIHSPFPVGRVLNTFNVCNICEDESS